MGSGNTPTTTTVLVTNGLGEVQSSTGFDGPVCSNLEIVDPLGHPVCRPGCTGEETCATGFSHGRPVRVSCQALNDGNRVVVLEELPLAPEAVAPLSPREQQVLRLAAEGYRDQDIARLLEVSPGTVRTHVRHAREKLNARSRTEAVARALVHGLIRQ